MKEKKRIRGIKIFLSLMLIISTIACYKFFYSDYIKFKEGKGEIVNKNIEFTSSLPVVVIDTNGSDITRENVSAKINIYDNRYEENSIRKKSTISEEIEIKVRGRSSFNFPKKQYLIHIKENGENKKIPIMGMPKESEWVLNGSYGDKSLIRNHLVYNISDKIMDYAPKTRFCEVFVKTSKVEGVTKEDYKGLYLMTESIKMSQDRINLDKKMKNVNVTSYIIARNTVRDNDRPLNTYSSDIKRGNPLVLVYPKSDLTAGQFKYIQKDVDLIEKRMNSMMFHDPEHGYRNYIDVDSFIDYVIINEFFYNYDAGKLSVYFHKSPGDKLKAGPVWDFDVSIGNFPESVNHRELLMIKQPWFEKLLTNRYFVEKMATRYRHLRKTYLSEKHVLSSIDKYVNEIGEAKDRNFQVWGDVFKKYTWPNTENPRTLTFEEEIDKMKKFIVDHGNWMDEFFDSGEYERIIKK